MSKELAKNQICLLLKNGIQFWMSEERADVLYELINPTDSTKPRPEFIRLGEEKARFFRTEISGFFTPQQVEEITRRKNGQWQCATGTWHDRFTKCECISKEVKTIVQTLEEKIRNCGQCRDGYVDYRDQNGTWLSRKCHCIL